MREALRRDSLKDSACNPVVDNLRKRRMERDEACLCIVVVQMLQLQKDISSTTVKNVGLSDGHGIYKVYAFDLYHFRF
jgi:hypothetical protein